ncbi:MAG: hypothetical protein AB1451_07150 [Nitrospirota bacterium]
MTLIVPTPDEKLAAQRKPALVAVDAVELHPQDWLVVCGGFEDRALAILENATSNGTPFNVAVIVYEPFVPENKTADIRRICQDRGISVRELTYDRQDPAGFGNDLIEALAVCRGRIVVDISGMSRLLIVQALVALQKRPKGFADCFVAYAEAQCYPPSAEEADAEISRSESDPTFSIFFLSSGVFEVTVVPELSSNAAASVQTRLIAFPSLDAHQLTALRAELQPSRLSIIEGIPPGAHNQWRQGTIARVNRLDQIQDAERYKVSTLNYEETLSSLLALYVKHGVYERLLVSPTGSKMQAVAVGILRSFVEDIQIVYPTPRDFLKPERYTQGVGQLYLLELGPLSEN